MSKAMYCLYTFERTFTVCLVLVRIERLLCNPLSEEAQMHFGNVLVLLFND